MSNLCGESSPSRQKITNFINYQNYPPERQEAPSAEHPDGRAQTTVLREATDWHTRTLHGREEIVPAIQEILQAVRAADYSPRDQFALQLSLEEGLVNAIKHGHQDDPRKEVQLRYRLTLDDFLVEIEDQGPGFKPADVANPLAAENRENPSGRGLLLMRHYMTWVRFNDCGNCVAMCRRRLSA